MAQPAFRLSSLTDAPDLIGGADQGSIAKASHPPLPCNPNREPSLSMGPCVLELY